MLVCRSGLVTSEVRLLHGRPLAASLPLLCLAAGLAKLVGKVFVPSITSESMRHATEADTKKFMVSDKGGIIGTETLLQHISDHFGGYIMG